MRFHGIHQLARYCGYVFHIAAVGYLPNTQLAGFQQIRSLLIRQIKISCSNSWKSTFNAITTYCSDMSSVLIYCFHDSTSRIVNTTNFRKSSLIRNVSQRNKNFIDCRTHCHYRSECIELNMRYLRGMYCNLGKCCKTLVNSIVNLTKRHELQRN